MTVTTALARTQVAVQQMGMLVSSKDPEIQNYYDQSLASFAQSYTYSSRIKCERSLPTLLANQRVLKDEIAKWQSVPVPTRYESFNEALMTPDVFHGFGGGFVGGLFGALVAIGVSGSVFEDGGGVVGSAYGAICAALGGVVGGVVGGSWGKVIGGADASGRGGVVAAIGTAQSFAFGTVTGNIPLAIVGVVASLGLCMGISVGVPLRRQYIKIRQQALSRESERVAQIQSATESIRNIDETIQENFSNAAVQNNLTSDPELSLKFIDDHVLPLVAARIEQVDAKLIDMTEKMNRIDALIVGEAQDPDADLIERKSFLIKADQLKRRYLKKQAQFESLKEGMIAIQGEMRKYRTEIVALKDKAKRRAQGVMVRRNELKQLSEGIGEYDALVLDVVEEMMGILNGTQTLLIEMKALILTEEEMNQMGIVSN